MPLEMGPSDAGGDNARGIRLAVVDEIVGVFERSTAPCPRATD